MSTHIGEGQPSIVDTQRNFIPIINNNNNNESRDRKYCVVAIHSRCISVQTSRNSLQKSSATCEYTDFCLRYRLYYWLLLFYRFSAENKNDIEDIYIFIICPVDDNDLLHIFFRYFWEKGPVKERERDEQRRGRQRRKR